MFEPREITQYHDQKLFRGSLFIMFSFLVSHNGRSPRAHYTQKLARNESDSDINKWHCRIQFLVQESSIFLFSHFSA